jgi:hypothetical protein
MNAQIIRDRVTDNLERVRNLTGIYGQLAGAGQGRRPVHSTDVLRAATVFLHATLEDFLRSLARWKLPAAGREVIDTVPLLGTGDRPSKFFLGELVQHQGKTVDDLIRSSVEEHLRGSNYGNVGEVKKLLSQVGVDGEQLPVDYGQLAALMSRRHLIVHRADRNEVGGRGQHRAMGINRPTVDEWTSAVEAFTAEVLARMPA